MVPFIQKGKFSGLKRKFRGDPKRGALSPPLLRVPCGWGKGRVNPLSGKGKRGEKLAAFSRGKTPGGSQKYPLQEGGCPFRIGPLRGGPRTRGKKNSPKRGGRGGGEPNYTSEGGTKHGGPLQRREEWPTTGGLSSDDTV